MSTKVLATSREAVFAPNDRIWTSDGYIEAGYLVGLECRWTDDDTMQVKYIGNWVTVQSQDFLFSE